MKLQVIALTGMMSLFSFALSAQVVTKDSLNVLKQEKELLAISKKINDYKIELAKLENDIVDKTKEAEKTAKDAQGYADENAKAAEKLSKDPQNKKLARKASKAASKAQRESRKAKRATDHLDDMNKDIAALKNKIAQEEGRLPR